MGEYPDWRDEKREQEASRSQANIGFEDLEEALCAEPAEGKIQIRGTETVLERMNAEEYIENRDIDYELVDSFLNELVDNVPENLDDNIDSRGSFNQFAVNAPILNIQQAATIAYQTVMRKKKRDTDLDSRLGYQFEQSFRHQKHHGAQNNWRECSIEFIKDLTTEEKDGRLLKAVDLMATDQEFDESTVRAVSGTDQDEYDELKYGIDDSKISCKSMDRYIEGISDMVYWEKDYSI